VRSFLDFVAEAKNVPRSARKAEIARVVAACGLEEVKDRIIGHLSKGYRQRVGIAQALLNKPQVLILDEPTIGLDPEQVVEIRRLIRDLGADRTVILSTHILSEVSSVCDRVIVIDKGRILASQSLAKLQEQLRHTRQVRVEVDGPEESVQGALVRLPRVEAVRRVAPNRQPSAANHSHLYVVEYRGDDIRRDVSKTVMESGWGLLEVRSLEPTLEDLYLQLIRDSEHIISQEQ
jgi:ABC-2 type transport system ATP-binding protein